MAEVVEMPKPAKREPVWYDIAVCHHWDGEIQTWVKGVDPNNTDNGKAIAAALRQVADGFDPCAQAYKKPDAD